VTKHQYAAQVRWSDADVMGHVNHARYLSYFEDARMDLLSAGPMGLAGAPGDRGYIAARLAIDYQFPATYRPGIMLRVDTVVSKVGTSSYTFTQSLFDGETPIATCECVLVAYSYAESRTRPLADDERTYLAKFQ
jgi:acyl-CoA thioester hydrolase